MPLFQETQVTFGKHMLHSIKTMFNKVNGLTMKIWAYRGLTIFSNQIASWGTKSKSLRTLNHLKILPKGCKNSFQCPRGKKTEIILQNRKIKQNRKSRGNV